MPSFAFASITVITAFAQQSYSPCTCHLQYSSSLYSMKMDHLLNACSYPSSFFKEPQGSLGQIGILGGSMSYGDKRLNDNVM
jgi:hypothetical protein